MVLPRVVVLADMPPPSSRGTAGETVVAVAVVAVVVGVLLLGASIQALRRAPPGTSRRGLRIAVMTAGFLLLLLFATLVALVLGFVAVALLDLVGLPVPVATVLVIGAAIGAPIATYAWLDRRQRVEVQGVDT